MISDAPYDVGVPVLGPRAGLVVGLLAAIIVAGVFLLSHLVLGLPTIEPLKQIGQTLVPTPASPVGDVPLLAAGVVAQVLLGGLFGLLYATCQARIPRWGLIVVGVFYGFVLWLMLGVLLGWVLGGVVQSSLRSRPYLLFWLLYGLGLALASLWATSHQPAMNDLMILKD